MHERSQQDASSICAGHHAKYMIAIRSEIIIFFKDVQNLYIGVILIFLILNRVQLAAVQFMWF